MTKLPTDINTLKEKLAAIEHERWADWQSWVHELDINRDFRDYPCEMVIRADVKERWKRLIATPYSKLSEKEKNSDREQVDRYWSLVETYIKQAIAQEINNSRLVELDLLEQYINSHGDTAPSWTDLNRYKLARLAALRKEIK